MRRWLVGLSLCLAVLVYAAVPLIAAAQSDAAQCEQGLFTAAYLAVSNWRIAPDSQSVVFSTDTGWYSAPVGVSGKSTQLSLEVPKGQRLFSLYYHGLGQHILYFTRNDDERTFSIWLTPIDGGSAIELAAPMVITAKNATLSSQNDASAVIFYRAEDNNGVPSIFSTNVNTGKTRKITELEVDHHIILGFEISPDERHLLLMAYDGESGRFPLYTVATEGGTPEALGVDLPQIDDLRLVSTGAALSGSLSRNLIGLAAWSPDSQSVVYLQGNNADNLRLMQISRKGGEATMLSPDQPVAAFTFSGDGQSVLYYLSTLEERRQIWEIAGTLLAGGDRFAIPNPSAQDGQGLPVLGFNSGDGRYVFWSVDTEASDDADLGTNLYISDLDKQETTVFFEGYKIFKVIGTQDAHAIVFAYTPEKRNALFVIDLKTMLYSPLAEDLTFDNLRTTTSSIQVRNDSTGVIFRINDANNVPHIYYVDYANPTSEPVLLNHKTVNASNHSRNSSDSDYAVTLSKDGAYLLIASGFGDAGLYTLDLKACV